MVGSTHGHDAADVSTARTRWRARRHRGLFWAGVLVAVLAIVGGTGMAYLGYRTSSGPQTVVERYFAALTRADAPAALGYADPPRGAHRLLTSAVLAEQQRIAAIRGFDVLAVERTGESARVSVAYRLAFDDGARHVTDTVTVHKSGDTWRLVTPAVSVQLRMSAASQRASMMSGAVPTRRVLLFPGAVPVRFDSSLLRLAPDSSYLTFASPAIARLEVQVSVAGQRAVRAALGDALRRCFGREDTAPGLCPLPSQRYVPGSLHGTVSGVDADHITTTVHGSAGLLKISGTVRFTGTYDRLTYDNLARAGSGSVRLSVQAQAYAHRPLTLRWSAL